MFIRYKKTLINVSMYADIRVSPTIETDINFYKNPVAIGVQGTPDLVITEADAKSRDFYFNILVRSISAFKPDRS